MKPLNRYLAFAIATVAAMASCSDSESDMPNIPNKYNLDIIEVPTISEIKLSQTEVDITKNINRFGLDLFKSLYTKADQPTTTVSVSPLSMITCLSLASNAFDKDFKTAIKNVTGCSDISELNEYINKIIRFLPDPSNGCELSLANSVWYSSEYSPSSVFVETSTKSYFAELIRYHDKEDDVVDMINNWCSIKTKGMIPNFIQFRPMSLAILNALYFSGEWQTKFDKSKTSKQVFHGVYGDKAVDMMSGEFSNLSYRESDKATAVYLPYDGDYYMVLVLPAENVPVEDVTDALTLGFPKPGEIIEGWESRNASHLKLPKFKLTFGVRLNDIMMDMGFPINGYVPEFDMVAEHISYYHKTAIDLDEDGTKAAAVSGIVVDAMPTVLTFDRPFLYSIVNKTTGLSLITGYVGDPTVSE